MAIIVDCYYLGKAENSSVHIFLMSKYDVSDISINTIIKTREAKFFEDVFPYKRNDIEVSLKRTPEMYSNTNEMLRLIIMRLLMNQ